MQTVPHTTPNYHTVAFYAMLDDTHGKAMRLVDGNVYFVADDTGLWTQLQDTDVPRLQLLGRIDISDAKLVEDGDRVHRCSRTLQQVA